MTIANRTDDAGPLDALVAGIAQTLRTDDSPPARAQAAAQVEQLRELLAHAAQMLGPDRSVRFDIARLGDALRGFADWLRDPAGDDDPRARQVTAELEAAVGPLIGALQARDDEAELAGHRQDAIDAIDDHFRDHPIAPLEL